MDDSERPQLRYARSDTLKGEMDALRQALELARAIEELLEDTRSLTTVAATSSAPSSVYPPRDPRAHSTRIARAMAASLVDELEALVRPASKRGIPVAVANESLLVAADEASGLGVGKRCS